MANPVQCCIVDMPDGCFAVIAVLASGKPFRRVGLRTLAKPEESVGMLRDIMAACGPQATVARGTDSGALAHRARQAAAVRSLH